MAGGSELSREILAAMLDPAPIHIFQSGSSYARRTSRGFSWSASAPIRSRSLWYCPSRLREPRRRLEMCREEVRLNHRLAPAYYLGVDSIVRRENGLRLVSGEQPGAVEYAVRMLRIPEERTLASLAGRGSARRARCGRRRQESRDLSSFRRSGPRRCPHSCGPVGAVRGEPRDPCRCRTADAHG